MVADLGLGGGGVDGLRQRLGQLPKDRQGVRHPAARGPAGVPEAAGDVAAHDALDGQHGQLAAQHAPALKGRRAEELGHIGSGWASYQQNGTVCGIRLPEGLQESQQLPEPIYTPSTKAEIGDHDENISYEKSIEVLEKQFPGHGEDYATKLRDYTIALYKKCAAYALSRGIIIADTKFEFGLDENGNVVLGDEMLTPDSSRFWPLEGYEAGHGQPSFDKQFVRNWLKANPDSNYDLPQDVIDKTIAKYEEAYELLTGKKL